MVCGTCRRQLFLRSQPPEGNMTTDACQGAWDRFMERQMSIAQDPERVLGTCEDDWQDYPVRIRTWRGLEPTSWGCFIYDILDEELRVVKWGDAGCADVHYTLAELATDGTVKLLTLHYFPDVKGPIVPITVVYRNGRSTLQEGVSDLPNVSTLKKVIESMPTAMLR